MLHSMKKKSLKNSQKRVVNKFTKNDLAFINFVKAECKELGVKVDLRPSKYVKLDKNIQCSGWFDSANKELVVAMNRPDALSILVHEYCHVTQWIEGIDLWVKSDNAISKVDQWLGGKRIHHIDKHLAIARDLELDNEKRAVRMIRKWKLNINVDDYIRKANAYVHFYNWIRHTRKWSKPANSPYSNSHVLSRMSTRFNMQYMRLTPHVEAAFAAAKI